MSVGERTARRSRPYQRGEAARGHAGMVTRGPGGARFGWRGFHSVLDAVIDSALFYVVNMQLGQHAVLPPYPA